MGKDTIEEFRQLASRTDKQKPKAEDVRALRVFLRENRGLWTIAGDLVYQTGLQCIRSMRASVLMRESLERGWDEVKDELGYQDAPPLERLLIEQVILCWLRHNMLEMKYTTAYTESSTMPVWEGDLLNKRLSASQRRFLRACETLARVRKIIRRTPALQINIAAQGGRQVNVANTG